ncbi:MAG TPA: hypothetical protein VJ304_15580 [Flavobacterium sp.]|jgi:hypothetical protein|nr:fold metallo-hydrolase [Chryseobacterium sp.]HJY14215.1 hypothetical protein [Flavobacterium sp.]
MRQFLKSKRECNDNVLGFLKGGFESWKNSGKEINKVHRISAKQFEDEIKGKTLQSLTLEKKTKTR